MWDTQYVVSRWKWFEINIIINLPVSLMLETQHWMIRGHALGRHIPALIGCFTFAGFTFFVAHLRAGWPAENRKGHMELENWQTCWDELVDFTNGGTLKVSVQDWEKMYWSLFNSWHFVVTFKASRRLLIQTARVTGKLAQLSIHKVHHNFNYLIGCDLVCF